MYIHVVVVLITKSLILFSSGKLRVKFNIKLGSCFCFYSDALQRNCNDKRMRKAFSA